MSDAQGAQKIERANELFTLGCRLSSDNRQRREAARVLKECLELRTTVLGKLHPDTGRAMYRYALVLDTSSFEGRYYKDRHLQYALNILNSALLSEDEEVVHLLFALAQHHRSESDRADTSGVEEYKGSYGDRTEDIFSRRHQAANCYRCLLKTPHLFKQDRLACVHAELAELLEELGQIGQARAHYEEACRIEEALRGAGSDGLRYRLFGLLRFHPIGSPEYKSILERIKEGSPFKTATAEIEAAARWWGAALHHTLTRIDAADSYYRGEDWLLVHHAVAASSVDELVARFEEALKAELPTHYVSGGNFPLIQVLIGQIVRMPRPLQAALHTIGIDPVPGGQHFLKRANMHIELGRVTVDHKVIYPTTSEKENCS